MLMIKNIFFFIISIEIIFKYAPLKVILADPSAKKKTFTLYIMKWAIIHFFSN